MYETVIVHHHCLAIKCKKGLSSSPGPRRIFVLHTPSRSRYNTGGKNDVHYHKLSFGRYMAWTRSRVIQVTSIRSKTNRIHTLWTQFLEIIFTHDNLHREFYPCIKTPRARTSWTMKNELINLHLPRPPCNREIWEIFYTRWPQKSFHCCLWESGDCKMEWCRVRDIDIRLDDAAQSHICNATMLRNVLYLK